MDGLKTAVVCHTDADGYTSAMLAKLLMAPEAQIMPMPFTTFAYAKHLDRYGRFDRVITVDSGSTAEFVKDLAARATEVIVIDHHEPVVSASERPSNVALMVDPDAPSAAYIIYEHYRDTIESSPYLSLLLLISLAADAAAFYRSFKHDPRVDAVLDRLKRIYPRLFDEVFYDVGNYGEQAPTYPLPLLHAKIINSFRKMLAWIEGAEILGVKYVTELGEMTSEWFAPQLSDYILGAKYPAIKEGMLVFSQSIQVLSNWRNTAEVVKKDGDVAYAIINNRYDLASYVAGELRKQNGINLAIVWNRYFGNVSIRSNPAKYNSALIGREFFGGGGHDGAGGGGFSGTPAEFEETVRKIRATINNTTKEFFATNGQ